MNPESGSLNTKF